MAGLDKIRPNNLQNLISDESALAFGVAADSAGRLDFYPKRPLDGSNYFILKISTSSPLKCKLLLDGENMDFFLTASEAAVDFNMILAMSASKMTGRVALGIQFEPLAGAAEITVRSIEFSTVPDIPEIAFIDNGIIRAGAKMTWGGGICWLECLLDRVDQVVMPDGRARIGPGCRDLDGARLISDHVNLFNSHDTGRLVQQSYYGTGKAPYKSVLYNKSPWPWNPVQGGDMRDNTSRIVDYSNTGTAIYVKCRPLDWSHVNEPTDSYMESWISLENGLLNVTARFTDFSPYEHPATSQEMPAVYFGAPLRRFVCYNGDKPFTGDPELHFEENWPDMWKVHEHDREFKAAENWSAWVNEDGWGAGVRSPGITKHIIARFGEPVFETEAYLADPTTYISPIGDIKINRFEAFEYEYSLTAGTLEQIRARFCAMR